MKAHALAGKRLDAVFIERTSAHPGSWLAALRVAQRVVVLTERLVPHHLAHGMELARSVLLREAVKASGVRAQMKQGTHCYIVGPTLHAQPQIVMAYDVAPTGIVFQGLNRHKWDEAALNQANAQLSESTCVGQGVVGEPPSPGLRCVLSARARL